VDVTAYVCLWKPQLKQRVPLQWSRHNGVARCIVAISIVLISNAPSESADRCRSIRGKYSTSSPATAPEMLSSEVTPGSLAEAEPDAHQFYVTVVFNG
jgi:hypothetical protein